MRRRTRDLHTTYIVDLLRKTGFTFVGYVIPAALIECKRIHLKFGRLIKEKTQ